MFENVYFIETEIYYEICNGMYLLKNNCLRRKIYNFSFKFINSQYKIL